MLVFVLKMSFAHEGDAVLGVYSSRAKVDDVIDTIRNNPLFARKAWIEEVAGDRLDVEERELDDVPRYAWEKR